LNPIPKELKYYAEIMMDKARTKYSSDINQISEHWDEYIRDLENFVPAYQRELYSQALSYGLLAKR
jgi:capsid protein